jgi:preprotein translocase subunit SecG
MEMFVKILHFAACIGLIFFVLLHSGKSGGLADVFGGGVSSTFSSSSLIQKNLDRITIALAGTFAATTVVLVRYYS